RPHLQAASAQSGEAAVWIDLLEADALAATGDTAGVREAVAAHEDGLPGLRAWRARIQAARAARDIAGARTLANAARVWASTDQTRSEFFVTAARLAIDMGDVAAGRSALRAAIDLDAAGPYAREAAGLLAAGDAAPADALAIARVHSAQGLHVQAVSDYERWLEANTGNVEQHAAVLMEYANALFYAGEYRRSIAALQPIASRSEARLLIARAEEHRGDHDEAVRIYLSLPGSNALFLAAASRHDEGDVPRARELYQRVVAQYPGTDRMGLAMMRLAGIAFEQGDHAEAARIWQQYRSRYPRGSRAAQAAYWQGRALEAAGDTGAAAVLFRAVRDAERDSYYALLAGRRIDEPFWPLPMSSAPAPDVAAAARVAGWVRGVDLLRAAGFDDEASAEADLVVSRAGSDRESLYALAEALIERGYSQRAIRLGLRLQTAEPPDRRLLRIMYPFPYRTLITEEARDRVLDPFIAAALIRQESMFEARITSHVGARGLMQIMPATGTELADAAEVDPWDAELLYHPEINVHLGTRLLAGHMEDYDGSLPSVFSAYNAGPHRVESWSEYPEHGRDELFTERIPYAETRNYVRILTRNIAIYRGLYGDDPSF
ncbi:MAG: transglycosylase SLT domain-containing protein, partial [Gemmatimonadota bacterium]